ncbi:winged helix-turn-helix transcriptional regulator [Cetobacterium sp. 2A]|uniref:PfkB family carbohydrate kinase n=1 Tax=unclassified Cetobacterium TaxID=2630983 RepID=UPI00163BA028|nr:PfkB family carbohydrate kinase [Cetobacterium sp. 2A]MBC2857367.1 winged helix-turn-helix transcriptional regulator [Cetobacterium sp. 2A]
MTSREKEILYWIEENPLISQAELAQKANITRSSVAVHISNLLKKGKIVGKGYIIQKKSYISVIGGTNIDIAGIPHGHLREYDSNPGKVQFSLGGVGRNIADNLSRLEQEVELITVLGDDVYGEEIRRNCRDLGIGINNSLTIQNSVTSSYLFILDEKKDMRVAIAAMDLYDKMDINFIKSKSEIIEKSKLCIVDTNLPKETLEYIVNTFKIPIFVDCVSTIKAEKVKGFIGKFHTIKPNKIEAEALSGIKIVTDEDLIKVTDWFINQGVKQVFISLGEEGVYFANKDIRQKLPSLKAKVVNTTGAGDAFMAGIAYSFMNDEDILQSCKNGIAAATIAISSEDTINKNMSINNINIIQEGN